MCGRRQLNSGAITLALAVLFGINAPMASAGEARFSLGYPKTIGDLSFQELREPSENSRSTQLDYKTDGKIIYSTNGAK